MFEWILFVCVLAQDQAVRCTAMVAPSEAVCILKRDEIVARYTPVAAMCFPKEKEKNDDTTGVCRDAT